MKKMSKKACTLCGQFKEIEDFYVCMGKIRPDCKICTIKRNTRYQAKNKTWLDRDVDLDARRAYSRAYYAKNKEKYAEYRRAFNEKHPGYFKNYQQQLKNQIKKPNV